MDKKDFMGTWRLITSYTQGEMERTITSLQTLLDEMELEKKNVSNEVRRSIYYSQISNKTKMRRIQQIDEIVIPRQNAHIEAEMGKVFPDIKTTSLNRLRRYRKEKEKLLKTANDHALRVKQNARILSATYIEIGKITNKLKNAEQSVEVIIFLRSVDLNPRLISQEELERQYEIYNRRGV